jgi:hypothetical protein
VTFNATDLNFDYTAATDSFTMSGTVGVTVGSVDNLSVTFGSDGTPGLVITYGSLTSLDMTINTTFDVADVAFNATNLNLDYTAATDSFTMSGTVGVTVAGIDGLSVTFVNPGLVITDGSLSRLDMIINANFTVADVMFNATNLEFDYVAATDSFSMAGTVGVTIAGIDSGLLPVSWSMPNGSTSRGLYIYQRTKAEVPLISPFLSQAALNSLGVAYPSELCGRTVLYSRRNHAPFARASATDSNSSRSRNSSRKRL